MICKSCGEDKDINEFKVIFNYGKPYRVKLCKYCIILKNKIYNKTQKDKRNKNLEYYRSIDRENYKKRKKKSRDIILDELEESDVVWYEEVFEHIKATRNFTQDDLDLIWKYLMFIENNITDR